MPNGHGGIPRFGSPVLLLVALLALLWLRVSREATWTTPVAYVAVALLAWRLAWHVHLYDVMEYEGAYTPPEKLQAARRRHRLTTLVLVPLALLAVHQLWP